MSDTKRRIQNLRSEVWLLAGLIILVCADGWLQLVGLPLVWVSICIDKVTDEAEATNTPPQPAQPPPPASR